MGCTLINLCRASRDTNSLHMQSSQLIPFIPQSVFQHARWIIAFLVFVLSISFSPSVSLHLSLMSVLCLCVLNQPGCLYQGGPMTLSTADSGSKACWESSGCKGGIGARCDRLLEFVSVYVSVYRVLMCTLVFLGLQTLKQPVLANGIYGKTFKWYQQLIKNTSWHSGKGVASSHHIKMSKKVNFHV